MTFRHLLNVPPADLLSAFNTAFADYIVPVQLTAGQLSGKMKSEKTDLGLSVGAFRDGRLVGFILHGIETLHGVKTAYNGGTGVAPAERGRRLTQQMYDYCLPILREQLVQRVQLEVITSNQPAIQSYLNCGFTTQRQLDCYKGTLQPLRVNPDCNIVVSANYDWEVLESCWDILPSWQNARHAVAALTQTNVLLEARLDDRLAGYLIFNPLSNRIQQLAVHPDVRRSRVGASLLEFLRTHHTQEVTIINVDQASAATRLFLEQAGLGGYVSQWEMRREV